MQDKTKTGITLTISGGMVAAALLWAGSADSKINSLAEKMQESQNVYKVLENMNTRLSRIEGALGVKKKEE